MSRVFWFVYTLGVLSSAKATQPPEMCTADAFMTAQDALTHSFSNITITNRSNAAVTAHGLYVSSYDVNDCSTCFGALIAGDNALGAFVGPVTFRVNQAVPIGQNYLYNLIYNGLYTVTNNIGLPACRLPGCSWPTDDTTQQGWCLSINVMSRHASYTSSSYVNGSHPAANVVPMSGAGTSNPFNYKYSLVDPNTLGVGNACLGPIVCNDQTLTCSVSTAQNQSFQPY